MQNTNENVVRKETEKAPVERTKERVVTEILADASDRPERYAEDTIVPEGGE